MSVANYLYNEYLAKILFGAVACVALGGCVTYQSIKERPPLHQASSAQPTDSIVQCVLPKWMEANAAAHVVPNGDKRTIVVPVGGGTPNLVEMTLEVTPTPTGSHVEMRTMPSLGSFDKFWDGARSCM